MIPSYVSWGAGKGERVGGGYIIRVSDHEFDLEHAIGGWGAREGGGLGFRV
jgi:hypothetical protein